MKNIFFVLLCVLFFSSVCRAEGIFLLNGQEMEEGKTLTYYDSDLMEGEITFAYDSPDEDEDVRISLDDGEHWNDMQREGQYFTYCYVPNVEETLTIAFATSKSGVDDEGIKVTHTGVVINYIPQD